MSTARWSAGRASRRTSSWRSRACIDRVSGISTTTDVGKKIGEEVMKTSRALIAAKFLALAIVAAGTASAAEIKVLATNSMKTTLQELGPQFEKATEHKLTFVFNAAVPLKAEIEKGMAFDVAILSAPLTDDLVKQG